MAITSFKFKDAFIILIPQFIEYLIWIDQYCHFSLKASIK